MKEVDYSEIINPVINSAKSSLTMLKEAGVSEAEILYKSLSYYTEFTEMTELQQLLHKCFTVIYELRYKSINTYVKRSGITNIIDLGCGYSPRGLYFKNNPKYNYIGIDLPEIVKTLRFHNGEVKYIAADITNFQLLEKSLKDVSGRVLIITEGVLTYLTQNELKTVIQNIHALLQKWTGVWITADFINNDFTDAVLKSFFEPDIYKKIMNEILKHRKKFLLSIFNETEPAAIKNGINTLTDIGFNYKNLPFIPDEIIPECLEKVPAEIKKSIIENYQNFYVQCLYLNTEEAHNFSPVVFHMDKDAWKFSFTVSNTPDKTVIKLNGRLDSMSAPEFAEYFENSTITKRDIVFDCSNLEYISSSGLRVFLMLYKRNPGRVSVINQNKTIDEVLEQTNFKEFLCSNKA